MNLKGSIAAALLGLVAGVGCSSTPSTSTTASGSVAPAKWSVEAKASVRQLMAMAAQGPELDCAVDVVTSIYSPEDWTYAVAHPTVNGQEAQVPARMKDLEGRSAQELERRCGIKDTRAEDKAKADAMKAWNAAVDEWNALSDQQRVGFDSYTAWAKANGKPLSSPN